MAGLEGYVKADSITSRSCKHSAPSSAGQDNDRNSSTTEFTEFAEKTQGAISAASVIPVVKLLIADYEEGCLFGIRPLYSQSPQEREH